MKKTYESPALYCDEIVPDTLIASYYYGIDNTQALGNGKGWGNSCHTETEFPSNGGGNSSHVPHK